MRNDSVILRAEKIEKNFGNLKILKGIDLEVQRGRVLVAIGPSGSGKSTLLRCLCGLEPLNGGRLYLDEQLVSSSRGHSYFRWLNKTHHLNRLRGEVGMIFQQFNLFPHMTVLQNVMIAPIKVRRLPIDQAEELAKEIICQVGLREKLNVFPAKLSGGQQQRVAVARALAMQPRVLLFDEVTSALDPELVGEVLKVIRDLARRGTTMIVVTHEMQFAWEIADQVAFMSDGKILEQGPPATIFNSPFEKRTRDFLQRTMKVGR
jgi:ABC-type polar amino acid transport system ATPase subunit